jgi:short-subunit dehydrogenase
MKKLVVISGGTKGIGKALALRFLKENYAVAVCARSAADLQRLQKEQGADKVYIFPADLSKKEEVLGFAEFVRKVDLPIAALVNNAGTFIPGNLLEEESLKTHLDTNLWSAFHLTSALLPRCQETHIFNVCSVASMGAYPRSGSYSVSKFALLGFTKSLRQELLGTRIKVTAVLPGATWTDSWAGTTLSPDRFIQPEDVAEMIYSAFLLSPGATVEEIVIRPQQGDL